MNSSWGCYFVMDLNPKADGEHFFALGKWIMEYAEGRGHSRTPLLFPINTIEK